MARAELALRAAAAHGRKPLDAGRLWAIFGPMSSAERSASTGRAGVRGRMQRPLRASDDAAISRRAHLPADLLSWAQVQSTTATPPPRPGPPRAADPPSTVPGGTPRRRRRSSPATAAAARAAGAGPLARNNPRSEDEAADPESPAPATAAPAACPVSPRGAPVRPPCFAAPLTAPAAPPKPRGGARAGSALERLPGGGIHACPCALHPGMPQEPSAPRCCFPYRH